jgi:hypothetical protein
MQNIISAASIVKSNISAVSPIKPKTTLNTARALKSIKPSPSEISRNKKILSIVKNTGTLPRSIFRPVDFNDSLYLPIKSTHFYLVVNKRNQPVTMTTRHIFPSETPRRAIIVFFYKADVVDFFYKCFHVINPFEGKYPLGCEKIDIKKYEFWRKENQSKAEIVPVIRYPYPYQLPDFASNLNEAIKVYCPNVKVVADEEIKYPTPMEGWFDIPIFDNKIPSRDLLIKKVRGGVVTMRKVARYKSAFNFYIKEKDKALANLDFENASLWNMKIMNLPVDKLIEYKTGKFAKLFKQAETEQKETQKNVIPYLPNSYSYHIYLNNCFSKLDPIFLKQDELLAHIVKYSKTRFTKDVKLTIKIQRLPGLILRYDIRNNNIV